ncbi:MAG: efflux RND transporter permease subunit [Rhodobacteraceae bacterium]|nr:efflux RND transporter permease subunit [Paracoccaceae bacterium]
MTALIRFFVNHRTAANLLMAVMVFAGLGASTQIRAQFFPDIVIDSVTVRATWDGAGPEDVDAAVIDALEPSLLEIDGVDAVRSLAREGVGSIVLEFEAGTDLGAAVDEIEAAVETVDALPDEVDDIEVERGRFRDLVTNVVVSGPVPRQLLARYAEETRRALFRAGVTRVDVNGAPKPLIRIEPDPAALERHGLTLSAIATAVGAEVESRPAGSLPDGAARIRAGEARETAERLAEIVVATLPSGAKLRLKDVAEIREDDASDVEFQKGGDPAVRLRVNRSSSGDALKIQDMVEQTVAEIGETLPAGVEIGLTHTRSQYIKDRLNVLYDNALWGLSIVVVLLFLFLSARTAFWVAAGIPVSLLATVALMWAMGISVNVISLFALIIALGIVVDDAIVVGEHADKLGRDGLPPDEAATRAARRMAAPVFSATITTIIAFGALVFVGGRFGDLIIVMPLTLIAILTASLIEAFIILPAHMRHALAAQAKKSWIDWPSIQVNRGFDWVKEHAARPALYWILRLRYAVLAGTVALLAFTMSMLFDRTVPWRFFVGPERGTVSTNIAMRDGASREDTRAMLAEMGRALAVVEARYMEEYGRSPVIDTMSKIGGGVGRGLADGETKDADLLGGFEFEMIDPDLRPYSQEQFLNDWRAEVQRPSTLQTMAARGGRSGPGGDAIDIRLFGTGDLRNLKAAAEALKASLAALPGVSALEDTLSYDRPEQVLTLTPLGEALGFTTQEIGAELRARLSGVEAARFARDGDEVEIKVAFAEARLSEDFLNSVRLRPPGAVGGGTGAPLTDLVEIRELQGFSTVKRLDGRRLVQVTGDIDEDPAARDAVWAELDERILPDIGARYDVDIQTGGLAEQERDFLNDATLGLFACLIGIYVALAWIFASWTRPLVVMLIIPFGLIGAMWGHYWHGHPLSMFSVVGLLGMAGIIINDSIVLVTTIDEKAPRRAMFEAVLEGTLDRLRAVLLTTLTTIGGLIPLLFETSRQALFLQPTVITLVYGLGFGMLLVLAATPALVLIQRDLALRVASARRLMSHARRPRPALGRIAGAG